MRHFISIILSCAIGLFSAYSANAVSSHEVRIQGEIIGDSSNMFISADDSEYSVPVHVTNGKIDMVLSLEQANPAIIFYRLDKKKIIPLTPAVWIESNELKLKLDLSSEEVTYDILPMSTWNKLERQLTNSDKDKRLKIIQENINSAPALRSLYQHIKEYPIETIENTLSSASENAKRSYYGARINAFLHAKNFTKPTIGSIITPFTLPTKEGYVNMGNGSGKRTILVFLSSGSKYSLSAIPFLASLNKEYGRRYNIINIWTDNQRSIWQNYNADIKSHITWTDSWDEFKFAASYFNIKVYPTFIILNERNEILDIIEGVRTKKIIKTLE